MPVKYKRCPKCSIAPLAWDIAYFWGQSAEEQAIEECLVCQGKTYKAEFRRETKPNVNIHGCSPGRPRGRAVVVMVDKLIDLPARLIEEHILGNPLRDALRMREYGSDTFLTDGDRIWRWLYFPANVSHPMTWGNFLIGWPLWDLYELSPTGSLSILETEEEETGQGLVTPFDHVKA